MALVNHEFTITSLKMAIAFLWVLNFQPVSAQFIDEFNDQQLTMDPTAVHGWGYRSGDGKAEIDFYQEKTGPSLRWMLHKTGIIFGGLLLNTISHPK